MNPKRTIGLLVAVICLATLLFWTALPNAWSKEPTAFLGIKLGEPIAASMPTCKPLDAAECFDPETSDVENVSDILGVISVFIQGGRVKGITASFSKLSEPLVYEDLVARYGKPNGGILGIEDYSWVGKHVSITVHKPGDDEDHPGIISVDDTDVKSDPVPPFRNPF